MQLLNEHLYNFLEDVPLNERETCWFQLDGAPAHNALVVIDFLNEKFHNQWIGNRGPVHWPARSPDLTPLDFFLWGFIKNRVYQSQNNTIEELRDNVADAFQNISPVHLQNTLSAIEKRCQRCLEMEGQQFEHLL